ncbi:hypothetical protein NEOLEDRAFT_1152413 [Neolentinus lepideus HHB14362 ss-1]|uniref:Uncharacterized protein n=1 Tax=Neolentinus lepideus HHB14362 ss-1 TaxID=1314782 RepID=A0A165MSV1_9AGAM|nr:hypothetical protein NEOLEDRAFT_1152413 [Neolentinus lepideus HHB14362 ss-1]
MRSFTAIFSLAAFAFAGLTSAAPIDTSAASGALDTVKGAVSNFPKVGGVPNSLSARTDAPRGVQEILIDVQTKITPLTQQIQFCNAQNATVNVLTPIIQTLSSTLEDVVPELQALVGQPIDVILASTTGTAQVTVGEVAHLVANILTLVFGALGTVTTLVKGELSALTPVVAPLGNAVGHLLQAVFAAVGSVVGGLLSAVQGLVQNLVPIILNLSLGQVLSVLNL